MGVRDVFTAIIRADAKGAVKELKDLGGAADGLADKVGKRFTSISDAVGSSIGGIIQRSPSAQKALQKTGIDAEAAAGALGTALPTAAAAGAAGLAAFGAIAVKSTMDLDAGILALQRATSATAEEASALVAIGDDFGLGAEAIAGSLGKLAKNADSKVLQEFGVELARNEDGTVNLYDSLVNLAGVFAEIDDPTERARLANAAFGKSWQQLLPVLEQGREGLASAYEEIGDGQIRTQEQIDASEELRLQFDALGDAAGGLSLIVGTALIPSITETIEVLIAAKEGVEDFIDAVGGDPFVDLAKSALDSLNPLLVLKKSVDANNRAIDEYRESLFGADKQAGYYGGTIRAVTESTKKQEEAIKNAAKTERDRAKAVEELARNLKAYSDADAKAGEALDKLADKFQKATAAGDSFARILDNMTRSSLDNQDAYDRWSESWEKLIVQMNKSRGSVEENTEAGRANRAAIRDSIADTLAWAKSNVETTGDINATTEAVENHRLALIGQLVQFGTTRAAAEAYIAQLGLTPNLVSTAVELRNDEAMKARIREVQDQINALPPDIKATFAPVVDAASLALAEQTLRALQQQRDVLFRPVTTPTFGGGSGGPQNVGIPSAAAVTIIMPPGSDGESVVAAQTRWARRNGLQF